MTNTYHIMRFSIVNTYLLPYFLLLSVDLKYIFSLNNSLFTNCFVANQPPNQPNEQKNGQLLGATIKVQDRGILVSQYNANFNAI